jgi:hypothetical protein
MPVPSLLDNSSINKQLIKRDKGLGFFGKLKRPDGFVSTELSIGVNLEGKEIEIPTLVPTLTITEINWLLKGNKPTKRIVDKSVAHALMRRKFGKSPFADLGEQLPLPLKRNRRK